MIARRLLRLLPAACLAMAVPLPARAQREAGYWQLLEGYARGERAEALGGLERFSHDELIHEYGEVRAAAMALEHCSGERCSAGQELRQGLLRAAVMLHWDRDDADRPPPAGTEQPRQCPGKQADLAGRYAALLARWPESRDFAKRFFLTVAHRCQWDFCLEAALRWARDGLKLFPRDAPLLLAVGSVLEESATLADVKSMEGIDSSLRQRERDALQGVLAARQQRFKEARHHFEEALTADPELTLARLRLGRVLWRLGENEAARAALERAVQAQAEASLLYLAHLFLGQVHEDAGRLEQAVEEYRAALALNPVAQAAAVALSHALRLSDDPEGSRRVLSGALAQAGRRAVADPFWNYLTTTRAPGGWLSPEDGFDALRRETLR